MPNVKNETAPPELAELQAAIARLKDEVGSAKGEYDRSANKVARLVAENDRLEKEATGQYAMRLDLAAEIERLKGGQGEPALWFKRLHGAECKSDGRTYDVMFCAMPGYTPLFASQPAPVSVIDPVLGSTPEDHMRELLEKVVNPGSYPQDVLHDQIRATLDRLDKVKELNQ
jgi:hypothetical protein